MTFNDLGLSPNILSAILAEGYTSPTPIQAQAIPAVLGGQDIMAAAQTGTGKTAGFTLPMLEILMRGPGAKNNQARALVLAPTRELAAQVGESVANYGKDLPLKSAIVFGGVKINPQMMRLRGGVDILVATPGRLMDLYQQGAVKFDNLEILVLDEADRMLDMGFIHDIKKIMALLPKQRQTLLFSATFSSEIRQLAKGIVNNPLEISVAVENSTAETITQKVYPVDKKQKTPLLIKLIGEHNWFQVLVFTRTKHGANKLTRDLEAAGIQAAAIHGNKSQNARTKALADFKSNKIQVLVATDIAARGIDIDQLPHVVNFELPNVSEDYVHRIGRTGRAGATGEAISLVCSEEFDYLKDIERLTKQVIPRTLVPGFEPVHALPESILDLRPFKASRPKKPKMEHHDGQRSGESAKGHAPRGNNPAAPRGPRPARQGEPRRSSNPTGGNRGSSGNNNGNR